jgi:hypothetical protein
MPAWHQKSRRCSLIIRNVTEQLSDNSKEPSSPFCTMHNFKSYDSLARSYRTIIDSQFFKSLIQILHFSHSISQISYYLNFSIVSFSFSIVWFSFSFSLIQFLSFSALSFSFSNLLLFKFCQFLIQFNSFSHSVSQLFHSVSHFISFPFYN